MSTSKAFILYFSLLLGVALAAGTLSARAILAQPVGAGKEPADGPIAYNLIPNEGESVPQDKLSRASATIETRRDASLSWAGIYVDGQRRPSAFMGPTSYLQTVSVDIEDLGPGTHSVRVEALDSKGRAGGYAWSFTVV